MWYKCQVLTGILGDFSGTNSNEHVASHQILWEKPQLIVRKIRHIL